MIGRLGEVIGPNSCGGVVRARPAVAVAPSQVFAVAVAPSQIL